MVDSCLEQPMEAIEPWFLNFWAVLNEVRVRVSERKRRTEKKRGRERIELKK